MNKYDKHVINVLKMHQKIDFEENDNAIEMLVDFDTNRNITGFEMFGDNYYDELEEAFEKELIDYINEVYDYDIIINTQKIEPKELYKKIGEIYNYHLEECVTTLNDCLEYKWVTIYDREAQVYESIYDILCNIDFEEITDDEGYREKIIDNWRNYDMFDLGDFLYNYYPSNDILESKYGEKIVNLLKEYKSISLEDKEFIKELNKKGFNL